MEDLIKTDKEYIGWVKDIINRYRHSQIKAAIRVNQELLSFYWDLGKDIVEMKADSKWGEGFYKNLSDDLCSKLPDIKGFSETSLKYVKYFYVNTATGEKSGEMLGVATLSSSMEDGD